jgi:hypothetical protein
MKKIYMLIFLITISYDTFSNFNLKKIDFADDLLLISQIHGYSAKNLILATVEQITTSPWRKLYYSDDGGNNWSLFESLENKKKEGLAFLKAFRLSDSVIVSFYNYQTKVIKGNDTITKRQGLKLTTSDKGTTWNEEIVTDTINIINIKMYDEKKGYIFCPDKIIFTEDAWNTSKVVFLPDSLIRNGYYLGEAGFFTRGNYIQGDFYIKYFQYDFLKNKFDVNEITYKPGKAHCNVLFKMNSISTGFALVLYSEQSQQKYKLDILKTTDTGDSWKKIFQYDNEVIAPEFRFDYGDSSQIVFGSYRFLLLTNDNGENWQVIDTTKDLNWDPPTAFYFINKDSLLFSIAYPPGFLILVYKSPNSVYDNALDNIGHLMIFPNPAYDYVEINKPSEGLKASEGFPIKIYNLLGECVLTVETRHALSLQRIDVSGLAAGVYFVRCGEWTGKFVKM